VSRAGKGLKVRGRDMGIDKGKVREGGQGQDKGQRQDKARLGKANQG
jgi:hypothetical protein